MAYRNKGKDFIIEFAQHDHMHKSQFNQKGVAPAYGDIIDEIKPIHGGTYLGKSKHYKKERERIRLANLEATRSYSLAGANPRADSLLDFGMEFKGGIMTTHGNKQKFNHN